MTKRLFDILFSILALSLLSPLLLIVTIWIKLDSKGPVFFRQVRVARYGAKFRIFKFRTMSDNTESLGLQITTDNDPRITKAGIFLRKYKVDELPQFINVLLGDMSIVGPRPEVPKYVAYYPEEIRQLVLSIRPGITDKASIEFKNENALLKSSSNSEKIYIENIIPIKLRYYTDYARNRTMIGDVKIIMHTIASIIH
ncbi:sugar transferase [Eoetvoesiella caeni]|uniref:Lipopolysaccharide/colanic/teichoic acid biosynthesis glycosyltransferase n=1 Tax=Eoetvoesiella caeni TaxID=645616 RepID=A0A366HGI4_9BURK|nr:sugar transferase [Eoetvoesiella caeni]MCI2807793.1 sugar transferase [Eoetvoesiella caeni]NYT54204.1 sugar transferase [Eoetvoesiella caeni]RBP41709.1 lipopolysaccharide/colanic/teichoic acid biosynthesis glycosyltransferase [Eoetvoesiella caeni]